MEWLTVYMLLGTGVGFLAGLLGVGGGGVLVPLLVMIFEHQPFSADQRIHLAMGTSFACMVITSFASVRAHKAQKNVEWSVVYGMAPGIMLGALMTARIATHINASFIAVLFTGFMLLIACQMFRNWQPAKSHRPVSWQGLLATGTGIGAVSALASVGGGFLVITYLSHKNIAIRRAIGTSAAIGLPIAIAATTGYMMSGWSAMQDEPSTVGFIYLPAFLGISLASIVAAPCGARFARRVPEKHLKKVFAILCVFLSIKMLLSVMA